MADNYRRYYNSSSTNDDDHQHPLDLSVLQRAFQPDHNNNNNNKLESSISNEDDLHLTLSTSLVISSPRHDPVLSSGAPNNTYWPSGASLQPFGYVENMCGLFFMRSMPMTRKAVVGGLQQPIPCGNSLPVVNVGASGSSSAPLSGTTVTEPSSGGRRRKKTPRRSAKKFDPDFRGVSFMMRTTVNEYFESSLAITSSFKLPGPMRSKRPKALRRKVYRSLSPADSLSENETFDDTSNSSSCFAPSTISSCYGGFGSSFRSSLSSSSSSKTNKSAFGLGCPIQTGSARRQSTSGFDGYSRASGSGAAGKRANYSADPLGKQCASCETRKTPLWRDAEDGTPLCNACGIRYKKYRVRCGHCWRVPKKDTKWTWICVNCGHSLRASPAVKAKGW